MWLSQSLHECDETIDGEIDRNTDVDKEGTINRYIQKEKEQGNIFGNACTG